MLPLKRDQRLLLTPICSGARLLRMDPRLANLETFSEECRLRAAELREISLRRQFLAEQVADRFFAEQLLNSADLSLTNAMAEEALAFAAEREISLHRKKPYLQ